jgi:L-ascorbate oxidase
MNFSSRPARIALPLALSTLVLLSIQTASAQTQAPRVIHNPPLLELKRKPPRGPQLLAARAGTQVVSNEATLDLNIVYVNGKIWNPAVQRFDPVRLRSYQGTHTDPDAPFISPTLEINPGDTIRINLNNKLPTDGFCTNPDLYTNIPHCFNGTNLHTHGLWVNPSGNSDNVLLSINPGVSFQYEYNVPSDHPAGTFWYHTHRHGSTALQVSSGMAGALIIRGSRPPTPTENGDIDTLLKATTTQPFNERVLVLQQIQYACRDAMGNIKLNPDKTYRCDVDDVGGIEGYDQFGPGSWPASGRFTSINGQVLPTFDDVSTGQIERWRVIHGGVRDTINLQFRMLKSGARSALALRAAEQDAFVVENCTGDPLPQHLIAADGLSTAAAIKTLETVYQPAYRWDTLMVFPQAGTYCVIDAPTTSSQSVGLTPPSNQLLGWVNVAQGRPVPADITSYLESELVVAAEVNMPADVRNKVIADLRNGLKFTSFVPHPDVKDGEVTGKQDLAFNIDVNTPAGSPPLFQVNGRSFDPSRIDRVLMLGGVDEWTLKSDFVSHPFHIHVNPFQVVKILDPHGKDVSAADARDDAELDSAGQPVTDPQYRALKGVWKDTLWVKNLVPPGRPPGQYTIIVRTRYQRYIGDYVLHCHILDHEDQGMMQIIRVALPDGAGGTTLGHRH